MLSRLQYRLTWLIASAAVCLGTAVATSARAGDFQPKRVAADAKWLAFIDVEGLVNSTLGKYMIEHGDEIGFELDNMQEVEAHIGINPLEDIRSFTVYGEDNPHEQMNFVAIFDTTAAIDATVAQFTAQGAGEHGKDEDNGDDIATIEINGQKVHVMSDGDQTTYVAVRPGPKSDSRVILVTMNRDWMSKGLSVLDGKAAALDRASKPLVDAAPAEGTLMFVSCNDLRWLDFGDDDNDMHEAAHSEILKSAKGMTVSFGEIGPDTFINAQVDTGSDDDAQNLSDIMRGLVAMARFAANQDEELQPLLAATKSLQLKTDGSNISVSFKHSTKGILEAINAAHAHEHGHGDHDGGKVEVKASVKLRSHDDAKGKHDHDDDDDDDSL